MMKILSTLLSVAVVSIGHAQQPVAVGSAPAQVDTLTSTQKLMDDGVMPIYGQRAVLIAQALDVAIASEQIDDITFLLERYTQLPVAQQDSQLVLFAQALVWRHKGQYHRAIKAYRKMLAVNPDLQPVRMALAISLFENSQDTAALDQFRKLQSQSDVPPEVSSQINFFIEALQARQSWQVSMSGQYLNDGNINNAPDDRIIPWGNGQLVLPEKESAEGIGYQLGIHKTHPLSDGWHAQIGLQASGKQYWDNQQYTNATVRGEIGFGYQNSRSSVSVLPFYEKRWFGKAPFSETAGLKVEASHWLHPQWQISGFGEVGRLSHEQRTFLDGQITKGSLTALYRASPRQHWFIGVDTSRASAEDSSESNKHVGLRLGWGQEWQHGFSTQLQVSAGRKDFDSVGVFNIVRQDEEYSANASLWRRDWHFKGITPKLTWNWNKTHSNQPFHNVDKHQVFVEMSKNF